MINLVLAARTEALRLSRLAVRQSIRDQGQRLKEFEASELNRLARVWFSQHHELFDQALRHVLAWQLCTNITTGAQKSKARKSMASAVHISRSKVEA
jgi:hypothetical protein